MRNKKPMIWFAVLWFCLPFLVGCGLFNRDRDDVNPGVAFPQMAESPSTSEASLPKPVVPAPTVTLTATPTSIPPTEIPATAVPLTNQTAATPIAVGPQVLSFTVETVDNNPGKTITFSWQSSGGQSARIYNGAEGSGQNPIFWDVPLNGIHTVTIPETRRSDPAFELFVFGDEELTTYDTALVDIEWPCAEPYFFDSIPAICPEPAVYTTAVEQRFQGGRMILLQDLDWIYVLYDEVAIYGGPGGRGNLQWERYDNEWTGTADADLASVPPVGLFAPTGSLGYLWRENVEIQKTLGWALAPEVSFDGAWQTQFSENANNPYGSMDVFIGLQDGLVARLTGFDDDWGWAWFAFGPFS